MSRPEISLKQIYRPVTEQLAQFQIEFRQALDSDVELINQIVAYIRSLPSKHIRPALVLLSARLCGEPNERSVICSSLVEILHTATLIHDDIVDEAQTRRGKPSVNALWKNKISVLLGDFLFSKSLRSMLKLRDFEALELLSLTSELLSSGEILQIEKSQNDGMDEPTYYRMIWAKTASLFATSCKVGAITVGASADKCTALFEYGRNLGMAFQIKDDLFDFTGTETRIGKPITRDLKSNLITLPLIHTLNQVAPEMRNRVKRVLRNSPTGAEIDEIVALIESSGGVEFTESRMQALTNRAIEALSIFPDNEAKTALIGLARYNEVRKR